MLILGPGAWALGPTGAARTSLRGMEKPYDYPLCKMSRTWVGTKVRRVMAKEEVKNSPPEGSLRSLPGNKLSQITLF